MEMGYWVTLPAPIPERVTTLVPAFVLMVACAAMVPVFAGLNRIEIMHVAPGARAPGQLWVSGNSLRSESVMLVI